jgi:hypothetical protein
MTCFREKYINRYMARELREYLINHKVLSPYEAGLLRKFDNICLIKTGMDKYLR